MLLEGPGTVIRGGLVAVRYGVGVERMCVATGLAGYVVVPC